MGFNFPSAPAEGAIYITPNGRQYVYTGGVWRMSSATGVSKTLVTIADGPPSGAVHGQLWWESDTGNLFMFYDDGDSQQWVQTNVSAPKPAEPSPWKTTGLINLNTPAALYRDILFGGGNARMVDIAVTSFSSAGSSSNLYLQILRAAGSNQASGYIGSHTVMGSGVSAVDWGAAPGGGGNYAPMTIGQGAAITCAGNIRLRLIDLAPNPCWTIEANLPLVTYSYNQLSVGNVQLIGEVLTGVRLGSNNGNVEGYAQVWWME